MGVTEEQVTDLLKQLLQLPGPLKVDFQNAIRDIKTGAARKGIYK